MRGSPHRRCLAACGAALVLCVGGARAADRPPSASGQPARPRLRFAISNSMVSWVDMATVEAAARPLIAMLASGYPRVTYRVRTGVGPDELVALLASGEANAAFSSPEEYLAMAKQVKVLMIGRAAWSSGSFFALQLLVGKDSGIHSLEQLAGKPISLFAAEKVQRAWAELVLARALGGPDRVTLRDRKDPKSPVLDVLLGDAAACVVSDHVLQTMAELNPQLTRKTTILARSEQLPNTPLVARADIDPEVLKAVRFAFRIHQAPRGPELLQLFRIQKLVPATDADYDVYRRLFAEHERLFSSARGQPAVVAAPRRAAGVRRTRRGR